MILKAGVALLLLGVVVWLGFRLLSEPTTTTPSLTTDTRSSQFTTQEEAILFLEPYIKLATKPKDLAYHIVYHDNSQGIPGPSDWDMKLAAKVSLEDIDMWLEGFSASEPFDISWGMDYAKDKGWIIVGEPKFYARAGEQLALFEAEGVLFRWLDTF